MSPVRYRYMAFPNNLCLVFWMRESGLYLRKQPLSMEQESGNYILSGVIHINNPSECFICKRTDLSTDEKYCPGCGFPQNGSAVEQKTFYLDHFETSASFEEAKRNVKSAQTILFVASGLAVLSGIILSFKLGVAGFVGGMVMSVIFLGLGFWARHKPLAATVTALVIYLTLLVISVSDTLANGFEDGLPFGIMDIVIVAALAKGIRGGLKAEKIRKEKGWDWNTTNK